MIMSSPCLSFFWGWLIVLESNEISTASILCQFLDCLSSPLNFLSLAFVLLGCSTLGIVLTNYVFISDQCLEQCMMISFPFYGSKELPVKIHFCLQFCYRDFIGWKVYENVEQTLWLNRLWVWAKGKA